MMTLFDPVVSEPPPEPRTVLKLPSRNKVSGLVSYRKVPLTRCDTAAGLGAKGNILCPGHRSESEEAYPYIVVLR